MDLISRMQDEAVQWNLCEGRTLQSANAEVYRPAAEKFDSGIVALTEKLLFELKVSQAGRVTSPLTALAREHSLLYSIVFNWASSIIQTMLYTEICDLYCRS